MMNFLRAIPVLCLAHVCIFFASPALQAQDAGNELPSEAAVPASVTQPQVHIPPPVVQPEMLGASATHQTEILVDAAIAQPEILVAVSPQRVQQQAAAARPERLAYTSPPKDDAQYALMGEFLGPIAVGDNAYAPLGLQIRAVGENQFEALQFEGGLPGQESLGDGEPIKLVGRLSDDFVVLSGGPWAIFVEKDGCMIIDRQGNRIGRLERIVRSSPTLGVQPPAEALVLFDGSNTDQFTTARATEDGLLMEGADVKPMFQDFNMHVEFRLPYMPTSDGQQRGNSGCYLQSRYEVQVLDSFALPPVFNGCSSLYRQKAPDLNMCFPPLQWQTYDIQFTAPRWAADGTKLRNARLTVWHNGVKTHDNAEIQDKTGAGKPEEPSLLPIRFQNHSDPVRFRNIWIVDRGLANGTFPVYPAADADVETADSEPAADATDAADSSSEASSESQPEGGDEDAGEASSQDGDA